ncbi:MAG: hypothetical protein A2X61_07665 [Ignavibacteria bacterium GWB2_35_12]|nr:MAG: hypothetical protein A2X63_07410 [Ignavibacteria bacterium GWA2_35_8]OGU39464.1 MAG: hypothetical protein A2X61_07665 [Ignavibacteria bacterium GWB2_35_12]OGU90189.1 MAG: hypothetical protein A2220_16390 [Ignavibacteria bacterium RIFOXYA2_FULL_35_10]OGV21924.1 MAG: hypothetical protein A2475_09895 [Ignavibacteria bacterium RIFOXYC2_FULL_35_21]
MTESLVQWTLLNNKSLLSEILDFNISNKIGQEIKTDFGRIDFVLSNRQGNHLIVELETILNNRNKLEYCFNQTLNYKNVKFSESTQYCILYADETNQKYKNKIEEFGLTNDILIKTYSLNNIKQLYSKTIERLSLNVGLALPNPKNYTICYLRWLNKIMKTFVDLNKRILTYDEIFIPFQNQTNSKTNFNCYEKIASDFELIEIKNNKYYLTKNGDDFIKNLSPYVFLTSNPSSIDLTNEQKRLILKILTNGNWENKVHKINIYWFMRFLEVTNGTWLPKNHNIESAKLEIAKGLFKVSYKGRTMFEFLTWCYNYCNELGLVERIKSTSEYDQIILTPLGVEVNNIFSLDLTLKKSRMNLNFQYLE